MQTDVLYIFATVAFFIWAIRSLLYWVSLWQQRDVHYQEFKTTIRSSIKVFLSFSSFLTWVSILVVLIFSLNDYPLFLTQLIVLGLFVVKAAIVLLQLVRQGIKRIDLTLRSGVILILALLLTGLVFAFPLTERYLWLLILDRLLFFVSVLTIFLVTFPSELIDDLLISHTKKMLRKYKQLKVIIVVADDAEDIAAFMYQLLKRSQRIVLITDHLHKPGVIVKRLVAKIDKETQYALIPFSEAKSAALWEVMHITTPRLLVLGKIDDAKQLRKLVLLLAKVLPRSCFLIGESSMKSQITQEFKTKRMLFYQPDGEGDGGTVGVVDSMQKKDHRSFSVQLPAKTLQIRTPLIGSHALQSLIPGIILADFVGMTGKAIFEAALTLTPSSTSFVQHRFRTGVILVDGAGVRSTAVMQEGLAYLRLFRSQKTVIFGIDDKLTTKEIQTIGQAIATTADNLIIIGEKYQTSLRKLSKVGTGRSKVLARKKEEILSLIRYELGRGDVVLALGILTESLTEELLKTTQTED